jgi:hypothetical protein
LTDAGSVDLSIPGDREGSFGPLLIPKGERRFQGFDTKLATTCELGEKRLRGEKLEPAVARGLDQQLRRTVPQ